MNPYSVLGVQTSDSKETIKKAYRKLANEHHPDKEGGDTQKFQKIKEAYDLIKDGKYKQNQGTTSKSHNFRSAADIYNFYNNQGVRHKRSIKIQANISVLNAVNGGMQILEVPLIAGQPPHYINIEIPIGIRSGEAIRYPDILLHKIDVYVKFIVIPDKIWSVTGDDIKKEETFDFWELILGTTREILTATKSKVKITVPKMTQPGTLLKLKGLGIKSRQNYLHCGDMYVKIATKLPDNIPDELLSLIQNITK